MSGVNAISSIESSAYKNYYEYRMNSYVERGIGILFPLPATCIFGDFADYPDFRWSAAQKLAWSTSQTPPATLTEIPNSASLATYTYHTSLVRTAANDIRIRKDDFERLEGNPRAMASVWAVSTAYVLFLPKPAIGFTEAQKRAYHDGTIAANVQIAPTISDCLQVGFRGRDMIGNSLPGNGQPIQEVTVCELLESLRIG